MKGKKADSGPPQGRGLRQEAERRLSGRKSGVVAGMPEGDVRALLHELQVHHIELEIENEELLQTKTSAQEASDKYHNLFDFAPVGYFVLDEQGRMLEINLAGASLLGLNRGTAVGQRLEQFVAMDHRAAFADFCKRVLTSDARQTCEIALQRGEQRGYTLLEGILSNDCGTSRSFRVTATDITEHKQVDNAHRFLLQCGRPGSGEGFFQTLARYLGRSLGMDYVCIDRLLGDELTAQTVAIYNDGKFDDNVVYTLKDTPCGAVVGKTICCFPKDVCQLFPRDLELQRLKAESYIGTTLWSFDGKPIGLIAIIGRKPLANPFLAESILKLVAIRAAGEMEREQAEETLRRLNESLEQRVAERTAELRQSVDLVQAERRRFHEVLDALPVYVILLTPDYRAAFANRFFEDRFGKSEGRRCYEYLFNRTEPCENCGTHQVFDTNVPHRWEWTGPDGRNYDIHDFPFIDLDGSPLVMEVGVDITQRKQDEQALAERTAEVQRLADHLRALAVDLSRVEQRERRRLSRILHDHIQQLLVAARMQVAALKHDSNTKQRQATARDVDGILREALEASRSLTVELSPPALYETGLIGGLNWLASRMQEKHQFTVNLRLDNKAEPVSEELRYLMFECVRELLFNAVKHAGVRGADVVLLRTGDNRIKMLIRDEGKGFDPDLLKKRRGDEVTFGLFSIQQRLAHIGGEMEIATAPRKGTSITISVPVGEATLFKEEAGGTAGRTERPGEVRVHERTIVRRVLVVDDHKIMREGLVGLMQFEPDIEVVGQAANGPQAIELAERLRPDVIIMDINLGGMNGVEATKCILAKIPNTKVIALSMHANKDLADSMRDAGATAYLTKGGPAEDLIAAIRAACAG